MSINANKLDQAEIPHGDPMQHHRPPKEVEDVDNILHPPHKKSWLNKVSHFLFHSATESDLGLPPGKWDNSKEERAKAIEHDHAQPHGRRHSGHAKGHGRKADNRHKSLNQVGHVWRR